MDIKAVDIKAEVDAKEASVRGLIERIGPVLVSNHVQHWVVLAREIALAVIAPIEVIEVLPPAPLSVQPVPKEPKTPPAAAPAAPENWDQEPNSVVEGVDKISKP